MNSKAIKIIEVLSQLPVFRSISKESMIKLLRITGKRNVKAGALLFSQGEIAKEIFILTKGHVEVRVNGIAVSEIKNITSFGESGILSREKRRSTVKCVSESNFLVMDIAKLNQVLEANIEIHNQIFWNICRVINQKVSSNSGVLSSSKIKSEELKRQLNVLESKISSYDKIKIPDKVSDEDYNDVIKSLIRIPSAASGNLSLFGHPGTKRIKGINREFILTDYTDKMSVHAGLGLDGVIIFGGRRPMKFSSVVYEIRQTNLLLQVINMDSKFDTVYEGLEAKYGVV